jgi:toxin ParE1/3/4
MSYTILIDPRALQDIQDAVSYYDDQQVGLGVEFENELNDYFLVIEENPFFTIRYDNVRCLPLKKFPFMIHFEVNEEMKRVIVRAVFHTSMNTDKWHKRK